VAPQKRSQRGGGGGGASAAAAASSAAAGDSGDAVMARWLQSAGLQHLAASSDAGGVGAGDIRGGGLSGVGGSGLLPSLLMQVCPRFRLLPIYALDWSFLVSAPAVRLYNGIHGDVSVTMYLLDSS
jgi:hypothetical protein